MTRGYIRYRSDYKYQLASDYQLGTTIRPKNDIVTDFVELSVGGMLAVKEGYACDGPSGPVVDTKESLRASLVHDALYQLMRNREMSTRQFRKPADKLFREI